jgi:hypothetical protein
MSKASRSQLQSRDTDGLEHVSEKQQAGIAWSMLWKDSPSELALLLKLGYHCKPFLCAG